jgi:hypothetical protein
MRRGALSPHMHTENTTDKICIPTMKKKRKQKYPSAAKKPAYKK